MFRRRATKPMKGKKMDEDRALRKELNRLDSYTLTLGEKLETALVRIEELEKKIVALKVGPAPEIRDGERVDDHVLIEASSRRSRARRAALLGAGIEINDGQTVVCTCDETTCASVEHLQVMDKEEARAFNSERVGKELAQQDKSVVAFTIDALGTHLNDGHFIPADAVFELPSGRRISVLKASLWANSEMPEVPRAVVRSCDNPNCALPDHLKVPD